MCRRELNILLRRYREWMLWKMTFKGKLKIEERILLSYRTNIERLWFKLRHINNSSNSNNNKFNSRLEIEKERSELSLYN